MANSLKVSRVQKRGQVTIPVEIRQEMGLEEGDLVTFVLTSQGLLLSPHEVVPANSLGEKQQGKSIAEQTAGIFARPDRGAIDFKAAREEFMEASVRRTTSKNSQADG